MQTRRQDREQGDVLLPAEPVGEVSAGQIAEEGAGDQERQIAAGADDREVPLALEEGRHPGGERVVAALDTGREQHREQGRAQQRAPEDRGEGGAAARGAGRGEPLLGGLGRVTDVAPHIDEQQGGQRPGPEHHAPGGVRVHVLEHQRVHDHGERPAGRPRALHGAQGAPAVPGRGVLGDQDRADRPLAAEAETLEGPEDQQRLVVGGESAEPR